MKHKFALLMLMLPIICFGKPTILGTGTTSEGVDYTVAYDPSKVIDLYKFYKDNKQVSIASCGPDGSFCPKRSFEVFVGYYNSNGNIFRASDIHVYCGSLYGQLHYVFTEQDMDPATLTNLTPESWPLSPPSGSIIAFLMRQLCHNKKR